MIESIKLSKIAESQTNPRKIFREIEGLAEDIRKHGLFQAVLVRPLAGDRFELVFGARRFRACKLAGLEEIPAQIREMEDVEVLEAQVVENQQRDDVHPLEEADSYRRLMEDHQYTADGIAAMVGKSRAYVYARMKLCALTDAPRQAFLDGKLSASTALLIARIPDRKLQTQATKEITDTTRWDDAMSYREASEHIQHQYMLRLKGVPWSMGDADLVPQAGACKTCPKRTGNQRELFEDVKGADICTDPTCYERKLDATWAKRKAGAEEKGQAVLKDTAAKKLFGGHGATLNYDAGYIDLASANYDDGKGRTWGALIRSPDLPITIARDPEGGIHELVKSADATKALRAAGHRAAADRRSPTPRRTPETATQRKARRQAVIDAEVDHQVAEVVVARAERTDFTLAAWRILAAAALRSVWEEARRQTAQRRGLEKPLKKGRDPTTYSDAILAEISGCRDKGKLRGLVLELLIQDLEAHGGGRGGDALTASAVAKAFNVDPVKIRRRTTTDVDRYLKALAAKKPARKKAGKKKAARG